MIARWWGGGGTSLTSRMIARVYFTRVDLSCYFMGVADDPSWTALTMVHRCDSWQQYIHIRIHLVHYYECSRALEHVRHPESLSWENFIVFIVVEENRQTPTSSSREGSIVRMIFSRFWDSLDSVVVAFVSFFLSSFFDLLVQLLSLGVSRASGESALRTDHQCETDQRTCERALARVLSLSRQIFSRFLITSIQSPQFFSPVISPISQRRGSFLNAIDFVAQHSRDRDMYRATKLRCGDDAALSL